MTGPAAAGVPTVTGPGDGELVPPATGAGAHRARRTWASAPRRVVRAVRTAPGTALSMLLLTAVAFGQRPGQVTFDTKLDLAANPVHFMARALHLWNPEATSGELQNQAYGYLFPMGPFFAAGQLTGVPPWITQRLWSALLLCAACYGVLRLARALRIGTEPTRYAAALGYALAPRMLTEIGALSSEMLSAALLPWVLLPLVTVRRIGSPRRAAALSALAVLGMGGINAAVVLLALLLPGVWLLTRRWDRAHLRLVAWWCLSVVAVCLWWIVPLLLLGQYSLPFLDYIESSTTTTAVASLFQGVRGTNQWVAYIVQGDPWWPAGWLLIDNPVLMALTAVVALIGLAGLAGNLLPERRFLVLGFLVGLTLLTMGYVGSLDSPLSERVRDLLDGPLAPLRNVHKLEPVLRLPLMLGFAHGVDAVAERLRTAAARRGRGLRLRPLAFVPVFLLVLGAAAPAWLGLLRPGPGWQDLPPHWRQATSWLAERDATARTLLVPGTGFGQYEWGRTVDEPLQALAGAPWAVRNQIPLGSAGNTRMMDTVETVLASGRGSAGLADFLARSGFRHLLLRNDIERTQVDAPPVAVLRQALAGSPGIARVATFGTATTFGRTAGSPVDDDAGPLPAIEIYEVRRPVPAASAVLTADVPTVSGGPESLLPLLEQRLVERDRPVVLAGDRAGPAGDERRIVTDGLRRRERDIGRVRDNLSQTLTATEAGRQRRVALDLLPFGGKQHQTVATYQGVREVTASTAASFVDNLAPADPSHLPFAAVDGDSGTAWHSAPLAGPVGQWLQVDLDTPREVEQVSLAFVDDLGVGWPVTRFRLTTDRGSVDHDVARTLGAHAYYTLPGATSTVRITVLAVAGGRFDGGVGIRELTVPGTTPRRALRVPTDLPAGVTTPVTWSFSRGAAARPACFPTAAPGTGSDAAPPAGSGVRPGGTVIRCDRFLARVGEEPLGVDRLFRSPVPATYRLTLTAVARPGGTLTPAGAGVSATASSYLSGDPAVAPYAAVDGDPGTAWLADVGDLRPTLRLAWSGQRRIDQLRLHPADLPVGSLPELVEVRTPNGSQVVPVGPDGLVRFTAVRTDRIEIAVRESAERVADRRGNGWTATAGIAEVEIPALGGLLRPLAGDTPVSVPCGAGPAVELDGLRYDTAVAGTLADVVAGRSLPVTLCGETGAVVDLPAGGHRLVSTPSAGFVVQDATLRPEGPAAAPRHREVSLLEWGATDRRVRVAAGNDALLVVPENANPGWKATLDGRTLTPTRVDGWQQAWVLPAGAGGEVRLVFAPDRAYRGGLAVGALTVLAVLVLACWPARRRGDDPTTPPEGAPWAIGVLLVVLLAALGGVLPVAIVLAAMLLRQLALRALPVVVLGGLTVATVTAVAGRLQGHGQEWAYGSWVQGAMLVAVGAVVAAVVPVPGTPPPTDVPADHPEPAPDEADHPAGGATPTAGQDDDRTVPR